MAFTCAVCGKQHTDLPDIGWPAPFHWSDQFSADPHSLLTADLCIVQNRDFFVRGVLEVPILESDRKFGWGVWVSHKRENFEIYREHFDTAEIGPFFGWLATEINYFKESTLDLKTMAHYRGDGLRPLIILEESDHPLARQQHEGITQAEAWRIVHHCTDQQ